MDRLPGSVREFFLRFGGIEPPGRKRRDGSLTLEEREEISRGHAEGQSFRDDQVIIVGSFNYTGPANALNGENILVIGDLDETNAQAIANQRQLGLYARQEIDRIVQAFGEPL